MIPCYSIRFPLWEREHRGRVLSATDSSALFKRLQAAEAAVRIRLAALQGGGHYADLQAIEEALIRQAEIKNTWRH